MQAYASFRRLSPIETASNFALNERFSSLKVRKDEKPVPSMRRLTSIRQSLATRFWTLLEKSWLQILRKIPETSSVSSPEYKALLPTPAGLRPAAPLRLKDWVTPISLLGRSLSVTLIVVSFFVG